MPSLAKRKTLGDLRSKIGADMVAIKDYALLKADNALETNELETS